MVHPEEKIQAVMDFINKGHYFTINRPRQYGKTTTLYLVMKKLEKNSTYLPIKISFEGLGAGAFQTEERFCKSFLKQVYHFFTFTRKELSPFIRERQEKTESFQQLSEHITELALHVDKKIVLMIDEVDNSSNNDIFINFLGMLRDKFLKQNEGLDKTFHTIILAGVHDVKNLKIKYGGSGKYNSPWNIALDFPQDMSFTSGEITLMLDRYKQVKQVEMDTSLIARELVWYTGGYPFFVSLICKILDEKLQKWTIGSVKEALKLVLQDKNTNFESLIKNLENNKDLYDLVSAMLLDGARKHYNHLNPLIEKGESLGILKNENGFVSIQNQIYQQCIYDYMISNLETTLKPEEYNFRNKFLQGDGLDIKKILDKFQEFMVAQYNQKDSRFIEKHGRLIFLAFLKPIINGKGFDFKEVQISEEKRLDIVVTYGNFKYIIELKIWRGEQYHKQGVIQLADYLKRSSCHEGYLVAFDFTKNKKLKKETINIEDKEIFFITV